MAASAVPAGSAPAGGFTVITWNVNGARSSEAELRRIIADHDPDVVCLQEVKSRAPPFASIAGYIVHWHPCAARPQHHGVGALVHIGRHPNHRVAPFEVGIPELDAEGRALAVELDTVTVLSVYAPNAGVGRGKAPPLARLGLKLAWEAAFGAKLQTIARPHLVAGDLNVAVRDIDVHNPVSLRRKAGFTQEERDAHMKHVGYRYTDAWCTVHGADARQYTFWGPYQRGPDRGWRLDYQLSTVSVQPRTAEVLVDCVSSDHAPLLVRYN